MNAHSRFHIHNYVMLTPCLPIRSSNNVHALPVGCRLSKLPEYRSNHPAPLHKHTVRALFLPRPCYGAVTAAAAAATTATAVLACARREVLPINLRTIVDASLHVTFKLPLVLLELGCCFLVQRVLWVRVLHQRNHKQGEWQTECCVSTCLQTVLVR